MANPNGLWFWVDHIAWFDRHDQRTWQIERDPDVLGGVRPVAPVGWNNNMVGGNVMYFDPDTRRLIYFEPSQFWAESFIWVTESGVPFERRPLGSVYESL